MAFGVIRIVPIWTATGAERVKVLPAFHAFTGADNNTGRLSCIGKATRLQVYMKTERNVISSLHMLSTEAEVTKTMLATLCCASLCSLFSQRHLHQDHIRTAMASLLQAYDKVANYLLPLELWDTSWESISKRECADRPAMICRILSGILCRMATTRSPMPSWNQPWQMPFQLHGPSLRWFAVSVKHTVLLLDVLAEHETYPAPIVASAAVTVRMMRTRRTNMKLMMTMTVMICKDYLVNIKLISVVRTEDH